MTNHFILLAVVVIAYTAIHFIEMASFNARSAGVKVTKVALGYVIQNTTFNFTRFFYICLLPVMGYLSDIEVSPAWFSAAVHISLLSAFLVSLFVYLNRHHIVSYYCGVIHRYAECSKLLPSFFSPVKKPDIECPPLDFQNISIGIAIRSGIVYMIYGVGVFSVFLLAVKNPDSRGVLSQLSGLINGFATLLLTLKIEPSVARYAEEAPDEFDRALNSMMVGRLIGVGLFAQVFIFVWNYIF